MKKAIQILILHCFVFYSVLLNAQAPCNEDLIEPSTTCATAPIKHELLNYCSTLPNLYTPIQVLMCNRGILLDNPHWIRFIATDTAVRISIMPSNCAQINAGIGMQGAILSTCPNIGGGVLLNIGECQALCTTQQFTIGAGGLFIPGQEYWIILDGCAGSICDYQIVNIEGIQLPEFTKVPTEITGTKQVCPGGIARFEVDEPILATTFHWTINGNSISSAGRILEYQIPLFTPEGKYALCLENAENAFFHLVNDYGYIPGSVCYEFEVRRLPESDAGQVNYCIENAPYVRDGLAFFPPVNQRRYTIKAASGCDSIVNLFIQWIVPNNPENQVHYLCDAEETYYSPELDSTFQVGRYSIDYKDQTYLCDSSFTLSVYGLNVDIPWLQDTLTIQCIDESLHLSTQNIRSIFMPDTLPIEIKSQTWYRNGAAISQDVDIEINQTGEYRLELKYEDSTFSCSKDFTFIVNEDLSPPPAPVFSSPAEFCLGAEIIISVDNWDGRSDFILSPLSLDFEIVDINQNELRIRIIDTMLMEFCIAAVKPTCPQLLRSTCQTIEFKNTIENAPIDILQSLCTASDGILSAPPLYTDYIWRGPEGFSSTEEQIQIQVPGTYELTLYEGSACEVNNRIEIELYPSPNPTFAGSLSYCPGAAPWLEIIPDFGLSWQWPDGSQDLIYTGQEENVIILTSVNTFGCAKTFEFETMESDQLVPIIQGDLSFCSGSATQLYAGQGYNSYQWNGVDGDAFFTANQNTQLILEVSDRLGCSGTFEAAITELPPPTPAGARIGASDQGDNGSILLFFSNFEFIDYDIAWSNGMSGAKIINLASGSYDVTITHFNGCSLEMSFEVGTQNGFSQQGVTTAFFPKEDQEKSNLLMYPNPGRDEVYIQSFDVAIQKCHLFDLYNRPMLSLHPMHASNDIKLSIPHNLAPGAYIIMVGLENGQQIPLRWIKG